MEVTAEQVQGNATTQGILVLLSPEQQRDLYYTLEAKLQPTPDSVQTKIEELQEKYFDLVWLARSRTENHDIPNVKAAFDRTRVKYPGELEKLRGENGSWQHGFNSGMLACSRLLNAYALPRYHRQVIDSGEDDSSDEFVISRTQEIETAEEEFPMLDT